MSLNDAATWALYAVGAYAAFGLLVGVVGLVVWAVLFRHVWREVFSGDKKRERVKF